MSVSRLTKEYWDGVDEFIRFAVEHAENPSRIICPCLHCCFGRGINAAKLKDHLICNRIDKSYTCWTMHGETRKSSIDLEKHEMYQDKK